MIFTPFERRCMAVEFVDSADVDSSVQIGDGSPLWDFVQKGYPFCGPSRQGLSSGVRARVRGWLRGPVRPESGVSLVTSP